jgi:small-conductance mechanosensitive channel
MDFDLIGFLTKIKEDILDFEIYDNNVSHFILVILGTFLLYRVFIRLIAFFQKRLSCVHKEYLQVIAEPIHKALDNTKSIFLILLSAEITLSFLSLSDALYAMLAKAFTITLFLQLAFWLDTFAMYFIALKLKKAEQAKGIVASNSTTASSFWLISFFIRVVIWGLITLLLLDNLGINITALVAGLGVGGIAVALAVQNILGDLFCSLSILLDKPFEVGDFIIVDTTMGSVEKIGIKSTRIRSLSGEQIVVSNSDLIQKQVKNYKRMAQRRVVFQLGVTYQTPPDKMKMIPGLIESIIKNSDNARFDRAHFSGFGDFALLFEVVYFILSSDYNVYMDIQQGIYFQILEKFAENGVDFAYPTQTVFLENSEKVLT